MCTASLAAGQQQECTSASNAHGQQVVVVLSLFCRLPLASCSSAQLPCSSFSPLFCDAWSATASAGMLRLCLMISASQAYCASFLALLYYNRTGEVEQKTLKTEQARNLFPWCQAVVSCFHLVALRAVGCHVCCFVSAAPVRVGCFLSSPAVWGLVNVLLFLCCWSALVGRLSV